MFIASFYCYLNYQNEFIIDLDDVWKWLQLSTKQKSKELLETNFKLNIDYIKSLSHKLSNQLTSKVVTIKKHLC